MEQNIKEELRELSKQNERILYLLNSDPATKRKGLVEKLDTMEEILNDLIVRDKVLKAKATVWGVVGSAVLMVVWQLIQKLVIPNINNG